MGPSKQIRLMKILFLNMGGGGRMGGCEPRTEAIRKLKKVVGWTNVNQELKVLLKEHKDIFRGSRAGLVVERRIPKREVGVRSSLRSPCCILQQDTVTSQKVLVIPRKRWLRPDMTKTVLTGPQPKQTNKHKGNLQFIPVKIYENRGPQPSRVIENERKLKERGKKLCAPIGV